MQDTAIRIAVNDLFQIGSEKAIPLYDLFITELERVSSRQVKSGKFGAMMDIDLVNTGPVTIIIDSKNRE